MKAIVFVPRGCSAGWLGSYGNESIGTPNLDRFAAESVVFDRHISDRPDPAAACAAWLGGQRPNPPTPFPKREGGVISPSPLGGGVGEGSLLSTLRSAAVHTVLVRANHPDTDCPDWFYAGWGEVFDARPQEEDKSPLDVLIRSLPALLDRLAHVPDFLLWIEMDRLLPPWVVRQDVFEAYITDDEDDSGVGSGEWGVESGETTEDDEEADDEADVDDEDGEDQEEEDDSGSDASDSRLPTPDSRYEEPVTPCFDPPTGLFDTSDADALDWLYWSLAAIVTSFDAELGLIFDQLRSRGLDQSATWLLTSDHGYPFGEHGQVGLHRPWLHEELVHLPLFIRLPGAAEACRRVPGFTQPPDIATTLLDLFGVKVEGMSLLPLARGEAESSRLSAISTLELNGAATETAIRTPEWAFLLPVKVPEGETREPKLYLKPDDRFEVNDVRGHNIERADELEAELKKQC